MELNALEKHTGISKTVFEELIELAKECELDTVLLYGSRARGDFERTSDIDLAVKGGDTSTFYFDVEETTSTLLFFDVVDLEEVSSDSFKKGIKHDGIKLYEKDRKF